MLLFDEPVNGLDPEGILWIRNLLQRLAAEGRTVLVSSHLMSEMALTADHLVVIGKGRMLADGSMDSVISRVASTTVTIASPRDGVTSFRCFAARERRFVPAAPRPPR